MAVVYPTDGPPAPPESTGGRLATFVDQHIVLSIALALGVAVVIGFLINKLRGGSSSSSASGQPQTLYVPTSNTFINSSTTTGAQEMGTARQQYQGANPTLTQAWDASHPGIPVRSDTNGGLNGDANIIGYIPWGSQVTITGSPVAGGSQWNPQEVAAGDAGSTTLWYPVIFNGESAWVSGYDLSTVNGNGGPIGQAGQLGITPQFLGPPATGSGGDPFRDGHMPALRTLFSANHGVTHHVNNVIGA